MPNYAYKAADPTGKIVRGTVDAPGEKAAVDQVQELGYIPIRVGASEGKTGSLTAGLTRDISSLFTRVSGKDVLIFTQDLSALLEAGLPVDRALVTIMEVTEKEKLKEVIEDILKSVQGGSYLSDALAKYPKIFSRLYVNMVRAGEAGGVLEGVLERLAVFLENAQELKEYIKSAMVYPLFLVFVGGVSILIMMTFVIPKFSIIFADMGRSIPLSTQVLLGISEFLRAYWWVIAGALGAAYFFLQRHLQTPRGRLRMDARILKFPVAGDLARKVEVARFARTLGTLTRSGVPILQALRLVRDILGNKVIAQAMERVYERVKEGERLSEPLFDENVFPSLSVQMITVGEETGRLDEMLLRVAENYEKAVRNTVKRLISFLEPAMILLMGLMVGFIVISMLMAVFSMNEMPF